MIIDSIDKVKAMTGPDIFEFVAYHLLTQGVVSKVEEDSIGCAYRGKDGLACAVGCLIPDNLYSPIYEAQDIEGLLSICRDTPSLRPLVEAFEQHEELLDELQNIHDNCRPAKWRKELRELAIELDSEQPEGSKDYYRAFYRAIGKVHIIKTTKAIP